ncbi:MAG: cell division protein FtsA [bacterium]|nr:cell division protein FtsA [bacterium]MDA1024534.1 cell division protein FtsA [bacterium]
MADAFITGLDIGSSTIRLAIGQVMEAEKGRTSLHFIGAIEERSSGVHKGSISSLDDAVSAISKALEKAERMTGAPVNSAWVSIAGHNILVQESRGVIGVGKQDGDIQEEDVERAIEAARTVATPSNYDILHVIPKSFTVDGQHGIKDPVGMSGIRLEVDAVIVQTLSSQINNLTKSIYRTGLQIDDLVFSPLATAEAVLTYRQKELGVVVIDIGATSTTMAVFEEGDMLHVSVLPIGGDHITNDIAIGLRTSLDVAEEVKKRIASGSPNMVDPKEQYTLQDFGSEERDIVKRRFVAEITRARLEEIFETVDAELQKVDRSGMLPAGAVISGKSVVLEGLFDVAKDVLRLPVSAGKPQGVTSVVDEIFDPGFATAIGLAKWGHSVRSTAKRGFGFHIGGGAQQVADQLRKWFKSLIP